MIRKIKFKGVSYETEKKVTGILNINPYTHQKRKYTIYPGRFDKPHYVYGVGQFTGLHDKNGKEIYEGDIVQHDDCKYPFEVIFNQKKAGFVCKTETGLTQYIDSERLKVVGNIYE